MRIDTSKMESISNELEYDAVMAEAERLWDMGSDGTPDATVQAEEFHRLAAMIDAYEREQYPDMYDDIGFGPFQAYTTLASLGMIDMCRSVDSTDFALTPPSTKRLENFIVEIGQQWENAPTMILKVEALLELSGMRVELLRDATDAEMDSRGYVGQYRFEEGAFHLVVPQMRAL